jgi:hypothetical protein
MAHTRCILGKQGYMHIRACARPHTPTPTRCHAYTDPHFWSVHGPISNTYCISTATLIRERPSVLRVHCQCCFKITTSFGLKDSNSGNPPDVLRTADVSSRVIFLSAMRLPQTPSLTVNTPSVQSRNKDYRVCFKLWRCTVGEPNYLIQGFHSPSE